MHCSCSTTPPLSLEWYSFCIACTWCFVSCTYLSTCFYYDRECSSCALYLMTYLPFRTIFWPVGVWQELVRNHLVTFRVDHCTSCCSLYNNPLTWTCMFSVYSIIMRVCFRCEYFQLPSFGENISSDIPGMFFCSIENARVSINTFLQYTGFRSCQNYLDPRPRFYCVQCKHNEWRVCFIFAPYNLRRAYFLETIWCATSNRNFYRYGRVSYSRLWWIDAHV
jgi:hypothetical protein